MDWTHAHMGLIHMSDYSVGPLLPVCQSTFAQSGRFKMGFFLRLWIIIAKALGIKLHPNEKPIISAVLHILTFGSAAGTIKDVVNICLRFISALFVTNGLISGYNVMSKHTKEDILDGTVSVMVMSFFCGLGVYSHRLAYR